MTAKSLLPIAIATLCCTAALAQQSPRSSGSPVPTQKFVGGMQSHDMGPGPREGGFRPDFRMGPPGMWWKNPDLAQKLSITADQQKKMDDIVQQSRMQLIDLKANVEKQELLLEPMLAANPPDTNKVLAQIDHVASARAELEKANARMLLNLRGVLSSDQWTKLQAEMQERRRNFHERPDFGPGPGPKGFGPDGPRIAPDAPNNSLVVPGLSGSGKSNDAVATLADGTVVYVNGHLPMLPDAAF